MQRAKTAVECGDKRLIRLRPRALSPKASPHTKFIPVPGELCFDALIKGAGMNERPDDQLKRGCQMNPSEINKVQDYLFKIFKTKGLEVKARKQKDSAEVFVGEEFIGVVYVDEDEEGSYMFEMAILKEDL